MTRIRVTSNVAEITKAYQGLEKQVRFGARSALNNVAAEARRQVQAEMRRVFDRPTPFVLNSVKVDWATREHPTADVFVSYPGGKGVDPNSVLRAEFEGGRRNDKRMERAFQRIGLLSPGLQAVPASGIPGDKLDRFGNVKGSFIVQLISYFGAFSEQGYRANMTPKRKKALAKRGRSEKGYATIRGVEYFVSRGRGTFAGRGAQRMGEMAGDRRRQEQHLPAGIWSRSGVHGSIIKPIIMFVRRPQYRVAMSFDRVVIEVAARELDTIMQWKIEEALATAR